MTRKDYVKLADLFKNASRNSEEASAQWAELLLGLMDVLEADNDNFEERRFLDAVGNGVYYDRDTLEEIVESPYQ